MADDKKRIVAFSGSLRKDSYNSGLLRAANELKPGNMEFEEMEIFNLPLYDDDIKAQGFPEPVKFLGEKITAADGLLFALPEYNFSVPGVLKNAIDWVSRISPQPFNEKPTAIMGASTGMLGTARAQLHFRQIALFVNMFVMIKPEIFVSFAKDKFDNEGNLKDEKTRELIKTFLISFNSWIDKLK